MNNNEITEMLDEANKKKELVNAEARKNYMKRKADGRLTYKLIPKDDYKKRGPTQKTTQQPMEPKETAPKQTKPDKKIRGCKPIIIDNIDMIPENIKKLILSDNKKLSKNKTNLKKT